MTKAAEHNTHNMGSSLPLTFVVNVCGREKYVQTTTHRISRHLVSRYEPGQAKREDILLVQ